jgi:hypothetical protein
MESRDCGKRASRKAISQHSGTPVLQHSVSHLFLALPLFVAGVGANHPDNALAFNNFTILAKFLN